MKKLLGSLALLLGGCGPCQEVALLPDERAWFASYQEGHTVRFRSNRGATNVLTVLPRQEWHENTNCNIPEAGRYQPIFSQLVLRPTAAYDTQRGNFVVNLRKNNPDRPALLTFNLSGLDCTTAATMGQPTTKLQQQPCTLATTGKAYPTAYVFRHGQNATNYGNGRVQAVYWDKQDGLIRYELADGETFDRLTD
ncbi:hypothetical protein F0P96_01440 [Hymenobacter busanensis]|uniref:Uncharacterized protein n=1 Tax=Hymenobacter busanensis TaxID=2607656 RepID=A0A7L4ZUQ2_9BACT|nr:hypothetical protein [Hymenobacter busanensis]KAA9339317.1 hypothetical protein F0P96_01440 [Hymenobacter busanensis]QHJ06921.1 hypothetical protein GUY19_06310 [Hymenobacter busanensis]